MQQQLPVPPGGNIIKKHWIRYYPHSPEEQFGQCSWAIVSIDLATKTKRTAQYTPSYTVLQVWGVKHPNIYLIDQVRKRLSFTEKLAIIKLFIDKWNNTTGPGIRAKLIEDKAGGSDTKETLQDKVQGIILFDGNDDKEERMESITWLWEAGNVYLPGKPARDGEEGKVDFSHVPWVGDFVDEVTSFPKSPFSDQAIAMSQALVYLSKQMKRATGIPTLVSGGPGHMHKMAQSDIMSGRRQSDIVGDERRRIIGE
jgi:predicted phage terminase large subunit-like protein